MKNFTRLFLVVVSLMLLSNFMWAQTNASSISTDEVVVYTPAERGTDATVVLHSQMSNIGSSAYVTAKHDAPNSAMDCQLADDFRVQTGETWYISEINLTYGAWVNINAVNVAFYTQVGTGFPATLVQQFSDIPVNFIGDGTFHIGTIDLSLVGGIMLTTGNYYIEIQGVTNSSSEWYWAEDNVPHSVRTEAVWQNPGDGWGTTATSWTRLSSIPTFTWSDADLAFELVGYKGLPMAFNVYPTDMAIDIPVGSLDLLWTLSPEVDEVQILFGTEYPPVNIVQDWTTSLVTTFNVTVDWNLQYFWQINTRNAVENTVGDVWGFTTLIQPPGSFTATAGDYDIGGVANDVLLEWVSSVVPSRALLGYDIYENAVQIAALVPGDDYTVLNATYNMAGTGNTYYAVAVFDEGISAPSNTDDALVNGFGTFDGYVDDFDSGLALENVTIDIVGVDPQGTIWTYQLFTDTFGDYSSNVIIAGTYDITASLAQYYPEEALGVVLPFAGTVTTDFTLTPWGPPACPTVIYPVDEEQEIDPVGVVLAWDLDDITVEYKILFSTEFPPQAGDILVDWTAAAESYAIPYDLDLNMQYFWKVHVRNMWGEVTTCDTWGFTTIINPPGAFTATAGDYDGGGVDNDVLMEWVTSVVPSRDLIGYNIFQNGTQIATEVPGDSYTLYDAPYNMTAPGNEYWAVAVFDEGVSEESDHDFAYVNGFGSVDGYAYEGPATATTLAGVAVHIEGFDPQLGAWSYDAVTDGSGYYSIPEVIAGDYDFTGTLWQYNDAEVFGVTVNFGANTAQDLYLDPWGVPNCVTTPIPFDTEQEVDPVALTLGWDLSGALMNEFRILLDTEYPPMTELVDWTPFSNHYDIPFDLDPNLQYFWQVEVRNMWGTTTACDIWGFTTIINPPGHFTATAFDGDGGGVDNDVRLEWESSVVPSRALIGYNLFQNGVEIAHLVPDGAYILYNAPYNMTAPGNEYWAIAVFDEGVSEESNHDFAYVNGFGEFYGYAYDDDSGDLLAGVTVDIVGEDPQGDPWVYQLTTDLSGYYSSDIIIAGLYDFTGSLWQYNDVTYTGVTVGFAGSVQQDLYLVPWGPPSCATDPIPADTEQEVNANNTVLYWTLDALTVEYRLMFDTEYPPTVVMQDWTAAAEEYALPALEPSLQYFWQIQVRNMWGEVTDCDIWGFTTTITVPEDLTATVYDVNNVLLEWTSSEQQDRDFNHYVVYRDGLEIATTPETTYDDLDLAYNPTTCYTYNVEAVFDEGESDWSDDATACITGFGMVDGYVYDNLTSDPIVGATVYLDGEGELGDLYDYTFTTDSYGYYEGDVMVGNYDYEVSAVGYLPAFTNDDIAYDATTTNDFYLDEEPYPVDVVIATEVSDDQVHLEWSFTSRDIEDYSIYRGLWDDAFGDMTYVGNTTQTQSDDYDWGAQTSGVYKWAVVVNYTNNSSVPAYSNFLDKDMETVVNIEVVLNSAESPAGTSVTFVNTSEPYFDPPFGYELTLDASGLATIDPFRKGTYEIEVSLFGYGTIYAVEDIYDETDLYYLLYEIITAPTNLYVNPNGFATWDMPAPGGLDMYVADFEGGFPDDITLVNDGDVGGSWVPTIYGYIGDGAFSWYGFPTDTRLNTPKVALDGTTVVQFAWALYYYWDTELTIEISFNEGLTWETIWSSDDVSDPAGWWYEATIDLAALGYTSGDAMFSIHKWDDNGWYGWFDELYIGPGTVTAGNVAISTQFNMSDDKSNIDIVAVMEGVEMLPNNLLASTVNTDGDRSLLSFKVWLDEVLSGEPTVQEWDYEANESLVEGQTYLAEVAAEYTTGISDKAEYWFTYHSCAYFDGPTSVSADVVTGTMDVMVTWTAVGSNVSGDDVVGVNVFRDGVLIAMVPVGDDFYVDEQLDAAYYTYCITNFYESEAQSCQVCDDVTVTPGGYVNGYVYEFATGNAPIEDATVAMVGPTDSYVFTTDEDGYYEGEVVAGEYDYTVSAAGYASEILEEVLVDFGTTVSEDFYLKEYPYPVGEVLAWELDDNAVQVSWSGQGAPGVAEWLYYDDGVNANNLGTASGDFTMAWAIKFDPAQLVEFENCAVTKMQYYGGTLTGNNDPSSIAVMIWSGDDASTVLYTEDVTSQISFAGEWNEFDLATAVPFDNTEALWLGFYIEGTGPCYPGSFGYQEAPTGNADFYDFNASGWTSLTNLGYPGYAWNTRAFVTDDYGTVMAINPRPAPAQLGKAYPNGQLDIVANPNPEASRLYGPMDESSREIVGYNVYRGPCYGVAEDMVFQGFTLDETFTDNTWGVAEWGVYKWAVEVIYDFNASEFAYSNCLDKDMETIVTVEVTTNSGDSPEGTDVVFTNVSEITDPPIVFEAELDASGIHSWTDFRKGVYDIYVHLNGFADINVSGVEIFDESYFEFMLEELLAPPSDLYVTPLGYATWSAGGVVPFVPFFEDFNDGLPDDWTIVVGGNTADTWFWEDNGELGGTPYMMVDSDAAGSGSNMDELLISPVIENTENADALFVEWDQNYQNFAGVDHIAIEVFDGDDWVEVFYQDSDDPSWPTVVHNSVDVTEYANADFQVRFHYVAPTWDWYWGVDNVAVNEGESKYADRMLEYYKVWHDYVFITDQDTTFYQYGDNGEVLVPYTTYHAEVAAVYSTGMSPKSWYDWTYIPCEDYPGPAQFYAEYIVDSDPKDVLLTWSDIIPMELVFITQNPGEHANGYYQSYDMGYGVIFDLSAYPDALANSIEFRHASWGVYGPFDYNIHIIDFDTEEYIASFGPFITTGDDIWEMDIPLEDVDLGGAVNVGFLMEPLSYSPTDAYPCISSDNAGDPQGSVFGPLDDIGSIGSSGIGNFLMNIYIMTSNAKVMVNSTALDLPAAPAATARVGENMPVFEAVISNQTAERGGDDDPFVGANLYRDGVMIAEAVTDTFYVDEDLVPGWYDYCITYLYESGAHSCLDDMCIEDVLVEEDCDAPRNLTATLDEEDYYLVHVLWDQGSGAAEWIYYDDGVNVDGIGGPATFTWAIKFDPDQLTDFDGASVTKISIYNRTTAVNTLQIYKGSGAGTLLYEQDLIGLDFEAWNEVVLDSPVLIDVDEELWIAVYTNDGGNYPAACGVAMGEPNGDLITLDGVLWEHLTDFGLMYTWNLRAYVTDAKGQEAQMGEIENTNVYNSTETPLAVTGDINETEGAVWTMSDNSSREWIGYNLYRNGVLIVEEGLDNFYDDSDVESGTVYCYEATSVYTICGESDPSNEECVGNVGIPELDATAANLYPNPARDQITIEAVDMTRLHIVNYVGQVVYDAEFDNTYKQVLNTANYQSGVYVARIYTEKGIITKRFVINR